MIGKFPGSFLLVLLISFLTLAGLGVQSADAYRICTFKGKVVGHGWRTMIVNSNGQCATVNVGWRTKYIPSRRPCLGERVAVDFTLEDGFMKAIKVVSLSPPPAASSCYPPAPPRTTACREAVDERAVGECSQPQGSCARTPPPHVRPPVGPRPAPTHLRPRPRPRPAPGPTAEDKNTPPSTPTEPTPPDKVPTDLKVMQGEVVVSSPQSLTIKVMNENQEPTTESITVGLRTKFIPFRRPAVGERVEVQYSSENGVKTGKVVTVIQ